MAEAQFPPAAQVPRSVRVQEIEGTRFLAVRKAASELYTNPDNTPLMSYGDTLLDRQKVKDAVLAYEVAKGWVVEDNTPAAVQGAIQQTATPAVSQIPSAPQIGFQQPPAPWAEPAPQMPIPPAGAIAMPTAMQMTTSVPMAPPQTQFNNPPAPQAPPETAPMEMPVGKARRGRPAALGSAVAPPPPAPTQSVELTQTQPIPPPPGPQMQMAPPLPGPQAPIVPLPPMPMQSAPQAQVSTVGLDALAKSLGDFASDMMKFQTTSAGDFKQFVGNLSAQINETNKLLTDIQATQKRQGEALATSFVAIHHLYLNVVQSPNKPTALAEFEALLKQYLPR